MLRALAPIPKYGLVSGVREARCGSIRAELSFEGQYHPGQNRSSAKRWLSWIFPSRLRLIHHPILARFEDWWKEGDKPKLSMALYVEPWTFRHRRTRATGRGCDTRRYSRTN